jgi:hypothetical protein
MAKPIMGMVPPRGWQYVDGDVVLKGYSLENLYKIVEDYRAENHLPIGDVIGDVNNHICGSYPNFCHGVDSVSVTSVVPPNRQSELLSDITTWAKNLLHSRKPIQMVTPEVAEQRAKICLSCTKNLNWRAGCTSCIAATDRLSASIRQAKETKSSQVLGGCTIMRHDNRSAIHFEQSHFVPTNNLPENCWINKNG